MMTTTTAAVAASCPVTLDASRLRAEVAQLYERVATDPDGEFHFHRGPAYAAAFLGYDPDALASIPAEASSSFAGVANPHAIARLQPGETVLDVGCGAGMDLLLAARQVGPGGKAIGVDMTPAMRERAANAARIMGLSNLEVRTGDAEALPVESGSVDVVISNGVLNLVPDKEKAFAEIARVLRPGGGRLQLADILVDAPLDEDIRSDIDLWTG